MAPILVLTLIVAVPTVLVTDSFTAGAFTALIVAACIFLADWMLRPSGSRVGPPSPVSSASTPRPFLYSSAPKVPVGWTDPDEREMNTQQRWQQLSHTPTNRSLHTDRGGSK